MIIRIDRHNRRVRRYREVKRVSRADASTRLENSKFGRSSHSVEVSRDPATVEFSNLRGSVMNDDWR